MINPLSGLWILKGHALTRNNQSLLGCDLKYVEMYGVRAGQEDTVRNTRCGHKYGSRCDKLLRLEYLECLSSLKSVWKYYLNSGMYIDGFEVKLNLKRLCK